jgi:ABC-2 type transport system permease protein
VLAALICRVFDLLAPLIRWAGADYGQFRAILQAKLELDNRRHAVAFRTNRAKPRNTFLLSLAMYAFMGLFMIAVVVMGSSPFTSLTVIHSFVMLMVGMSLISDFTGVLTDTTDLSVLGHRPVSGRTILVVRLAHITTYLGLLSLALSLGTLAAGTFVFHPAFVPVCVVTLICSVGLVVFTVNLFYLAALRFTDVERFKDLIVYFQVVMTVMVVGGYQLLPRLMGFKTVAGVDLAGRWWNALYPPCWFAAPAELLAGRATAQMWLLSLLCVLIPAVGLLVVARYLAPGFGQALQKMGSDVASAARDTRPKRGGLRVLIGPWVARSPEQRFGFDLVWSMIARDRGFKQRVYPQIAFVFLWPAVMLLANPSGIGAVLGNLDRPSHYLPPLYFAAFFLPATLFGLGSSTQFEAAWIYYALPLKRPGELMLGAIKALACRLALPVFGVLAAILLALGGLQLLPDVALAMCMNGVVASLCALAVARELPFSCAATTMQSGGKVGLAFALMIPPALAGLLHYGLTFMPGAVTLAILPVACLCAVIFRAYARLGWPRSGLRLAE